MSTGPGAVQRVNSWSMKLAVVLIAFGLLAIASPMFVSIGALRFLAWIVLFDGIAQLVHAFGSEGVGRVAWKLLVSILYIGVGVWLLTHPLFGLAGLTLLLALFFLAEGVVDVIAFFLTRKAGGSNWILLDGIITIVLAVMIWRRWPSGSLWVAGTLLGISMLMTGTSRLMMALAVRKLTKYQGSFVPTKHRAA